MVMSLLLIGAQAQETRLKEDISLGEAVQLLSQHEQDTGFIVLDVRTPEEFEKGHVKNAVNVDFQAEDFQSKLETLDKSKTFLVYCRRGRRSASAIGLMNTLGFKNLFHLYQGYDLWESKGNAVVK